MAWKIEYSKDAAKTLRRIPVNLRNRIFSRLEGLAEDPHAAKNVKQLQCEPYFRRRIDDWRVIYKLEDKRLIVSVVRIGSRGGIYQ